MNQRDACLNSACILSFGQLLYSRGRSRLLVFSNLHTGGLTKTLLKVVKPYRGQLGCGNSRTAFTVRMHAPCGVRHLGRML